ncbi:MAG: ketosynthase [Stenotrophobium sp.]
MPVLILAYPILVHLAVLLHQPLLQWLALCCLVAVPLYAGLRHARWRSWLLFLLLAALLYVLARSGGGRYALFLPPVLLPGVAAWFFGRSLRREQVPLITRIARATRSGELPPELASYTRRVTQLWMLALSGIGLLSVALALFAPLPLWSLFTNFINYLILAALFPLEYLYRRIRYRHLPHAGFVSYVRDVARINYRRL